ncbi:MAG: HEAT repeat domain-containing protein [Planctomycetaceae bacterium]|nr:HEAT repeat domain-containing protein [Planctomycetaceae bacterium]
MRTRLPSLLGIAMGAAFMLAFPASAPADPPIVVVPSAEELSTIKLEKTESFSRRLSSRDIQDRIKALYELVSDHQQARLFERQLIALATAMDVEVRVASIRALGSACRGDSIAAIEDCLRNAIGDRDPRVRIAAVYALGDAEAITNPTASRLTELLRDENGDVQFAVLQFLSRCPDLRRSALPDVVALLDSEAMRTRWVSMDFADQSPLAWDAARLLLSTDLESDVEARSIVAQKAASSEDGRVKFILSLALDPRSIGLDRETFVTGRAMTAVKEAIRRNDVEEQEAILDELYALPIGNETRLRLMLELSKSTGRAGTAAALAVAGEESEWVLMREDLVSASSDEEIREWLRAAIREWLSATDNGVN